MLSYDFIRQGKPSEESPLCDKIYMTVRAEASRGSFRFLIDEDRSPAVRFDRTIPVDVPTLTEIMADKEHSLISCNAVLHISGAGYPVITRGLDAYMFGGYNTCPAGRCDRLPRETAAAELNEEIVVILKNRTTGELAMAGFCEERLAREGKAHKEKELKRALPPLLMLNTEWEKGRDTYTMEAGKYSASWKTASEQRVLESGNCTVIYDAPRNTYELCFGMTAFLPDGWDIETVFDGERYNNQVKIIKSLSDLPINKCVPALKEYILKP